MLDDPQGSPIHLTFVDVFDQCQTMQKRDTQFTHQLWQDRLLPWLWLHYTALVQLAVVCPIVTAMSMKQLTDSIRQLRQTSDSLKKPRQVTLEYWASKACSASTNRAVPPALWTAAIACNASVVLPLLSGPYTCVTMHDHHKNCAIRNLVSSQLGKNIYIPTSPRMTIHDRSSLCQKKTAEHGWLSGRLTWSHELWISSSTYVHSIR